MATLKTKIQVRRDTAANLANVVLAVAEPCYATDTQKFVIGDGSSKFSDLKDRISIDYIKIVISTSSSTTSGTLSAADLAAMKANPHKVVLVWAGYYCFAENLSSSSTWYYSANCTFNGTASIDKKVITLTVSTGAWSYSNYQYANTDTTYGADRGISLVSGKFGHSNTAITATTSTGFYKFKYDAYGHITGATAVTKDDLTGLGVIADLPYRLQSYSASPGVDNADSAREQGFYYVKPGGDAKKPAFKQVDGSNTGTDYHIFTTAAYSADWIHQLGFDCRSNDLFVRRKQNGTWQPWTSIVKFQPCTGDNGNIMGTITNNAIPRWDTTRNTTIKNSNVTIDDSGNMVLPADASLKLSLWDRRFLTLTGNSITADMSNETGGWAGSFASVKDPSGATTTMLGWYGGTSLEHIFMGGSYNDPAMKMTAAGLFTFKNQVTFNAAQGTAPLAVTSTTKVTNLNADLLDGQEGSYYLNYNNLNNKPTIPTVNNATLTIQKNGTNVATFTANASSNVTANITVPNPTDYYWANVKVSSSSSTATIPSVQKIGITGSTTATTTAAVTMEYDSSYKALKFVFA